ncbi:MAG TPA: cold shock domain-containing protein [Bacteroidia bacterium]|jgi:cold shock CspA family protein|nr:cold shock domain-containing protein [Bacteroidia bacterium]
MKKGIVKFFNASQKFGFITSLDDKKDYYVHIKDLLSPVKEGDLVTFEIAATKRGEQAVKVALCS